MPNTLRCQRPPRALQPVKDGIALAKKRLAGNRATSRPHRSRFSPRVNATEGAIARRLLLPLGLASLGGLSTEVLTQLEIDSPGVRENIQQLGDDPNVMLHAVPSGVGAGAGLALYLMGYGAYRGIKGVAKSGKTPKPVQSESQPSASTIPPAPVSEEVARESLSATVNDRPAAEPIEPPRVSAFEGAETEVAAVSSSSEPLSSDLLVELSDDITLMRQGVLFKRIGDYKIIRLLGEGGFGKVLLGVKKARVMGRTFEEFIAVKVLNTDNGDHHDRYVDEISALSQLNHPNIVAFRGCGENKSQKVIVIFQEYVEGENILKYLKEGKEFSVKEAVNIIIDCARGLDYAWKTGEIIHRDIKPGNIMLNENGIVKILDLGLARRIGGEDLTRTGLLVGSPGYMSPEHVRKIMESKVALDFHSDMYSLGATLYIMLARKAPFSGGKEEILRKTVKDPVPDIRQFNPKVPEGLWNVIQKMLAKKPEDRHESYAALIDALEAFRQNGY
jgi:hypothetical protein